ncbi:MAG: BMP family ABC transporter substrate-binding protein [Candidatus Bipolaricaulia bacterium]
MREPNRKPGQKLSRRQFLRQAAVGIGGALLAAVPRTIAVGQDAKVAWILVGPIGDFGWSWSHEQGRLDVAQRMTNVDTMVAEAVVEPDFDRVARQFIAQGVRLIFACSASYQPQLLELAPQFPNVGFEFTDPTRLRRLSNLSSYYPRLYQLEYLKGFTAGQMLRHLGMTDPIAGYVTSFKFPLTIRTANAYHVGLRNVLPEAQTRVVFLNTWFNPLLEKEAGLALVDTGVSTLSTYLDSPAVLEAGEETGVLNTGSNVDMRRFAPNTNMVNNVLNWGPYYRSRVQASIDGTWEDTDTWEPIGGKYGLSDLGPFGRAVPNDVIKAVLEERNVLISAKREIFPGMSDDELRRMDFWVDGISGV